MEFDELAFLVVLQLSFMLDLQVTHFCDPQSCEFRRHVWILK
jgi:hypothetical protein